MAGRSITAPTPERARALLAWYRRSHRKLPWRPRNGKLADPYHTLVAEAMLQQTQVATVIAYFERFIARFGTVDELAAADEGEVLRMWQGLGYYRRARHLHRAAKAIVAEHGGTMPSTAASLRHLPGVGAYTAGAIASIAFGERAPLVDGNVMRVLARWYGYEEPIDDAKGKKWAWAKAGQLIEGLATPQVRCAAPAGLGSEERNARGSRPSPQPSPGGRGGEPAPQVRCAAPAGLGGATAGDWNQALMELGATVCTPRSPGCGLCPVSAWCKAKRRGIAERLPVTGARKEPIAVTHRVIAVERGGRWLVERRGDAGLWAGMWQVPTIEIDSPRLAGGKRSADATVGDGADTTRLPPASRGLNRPSAAGLTAWVRERFGVGIGRPRFVGAFEHRTTHRLIRFEVWRAPGTSGGKRSVWRRRAEMEGLAMSNPQRRVLAMVAAAGRAGA